MSVAAVSKGGITAAAPPAVSATNLPSAKSIELQLVPASPAEILQAWLLNAKEWQGPLSLEQYLNREQYLLKQDLVNNQQLTCWILTSSTLPPNADGTRPFFAACESLRKTAYVARGGHVQEVVAHGIGSVFTRIEYRGHGYAARMMVELGKKLETWQQINGDLGSFSVLYSDIGQKFYARFGWQVFPSTHVHLDGVNAEEYENTRSHLMQNLKRGLPEVIDLTAKDLSAIPTVNYIEAHLAAESELQPTMPHVAIRPDLQHFAWHHAREEFQSQVLGKSVPEIKGALHQKSGIAIIWARVYAADPKDWCLHILHVALPPPLKAGPTADDHLALSALLLRAQREAHEWEMQAGVEVWDPSGFVITSAQKLKFEEDVEIKVIKRDKEHLCSLKWIGSKPGDDPSGKVVWLNNEKYAWC